MMIVSREGRSETGTKRGDEPAGGGDGVTCAGCRWRLDGSDQCRRVETTSPVDGGVGLHLDVVVDDLDTTTVEVEQWR